MITFCLYVIFTAYFHTFKRVFMIIDDWIETQWHQKLFFISNRRSMRFATKNCPRFIIYLTERFELHKIGLFGIPQ